MERRLGLFRRSRGQCRSQRDVNGSQRRGIQPKGGDTLGIDRSDTQPYSTEILRVSIFNKEIKIKIEIEI